MVTSSNNDHFLKLPKFLFFWKIARPSPSRPVTFHLTFSRASQRSNPLQGGELNFSAWRAPWETKSGLVLNLTCGSTTVPEGGWDILKEALNTFQSETWKGTVDKWSGVGAGPGKAAVLVSWGERCLREKTSSGWGRNSTWGSSESTKLPAGPWCLCSRRFSEESRKAVGPFSLSRNTVTKAHGIKLPERINTVMKTQGVKLIKVTSSSRWLERYLRRGRGWGRLAWAGVW